jgi:hypothetical protein
MGNTSMYEPPVGGRTSSPKFRGAVQFINEFKGLPKGVTRFDLLKLVKQAGPFAGFSSKMIQLLEYYILFTRECDWVAQGQPIVFQALSKTALDFGVSERQIQRLENDLFKIGALTWNDSGNHRRYGVRADSGEIMYAFGVDLTPLAALREALETRLAEKQRLDAAWMETKRQISWYRRQIRGLIEEACEYPSLDRLRVETEQNYDGIAVSIRTYMSHGDLETMLQAHKDLHGAILKAVRHAENIRLDIELAAEQAAQENTVDSPKTKNRSSMDDMDDAHIYSTNQPQFDKSKNSSPEDKAASRGSVAVSIGTVDNHPACGEAGKGKTPAEIAEDIGKITWKQVLNAASPRFTSHLPRMRAAGFSDIVDAAHALLPILGVHKSAWGEACTVLGRNGAAICVMIIDQKTQDEQVQIRNPGGYLREMTARAKRGELNLHGSVFGLLKRGERRHDA